MSSIALPGRRVLVTGGAGGVGRALTQRLLAEGTRIVLTDRDKTTLDALDQSAGQGGPSPFQPLSLIPGLKSIQDGDLGWPAIIRLPRHSSGKK